MLKNYFKIALRNLWKNKTFSFLNIAGLAIGMSSAILILLWIENEMSYDKFHRHKENIYEVWNKGIANSKIECWNNVPKVLSPTLQQEIPEIAEATRSISTWFVTVAGDKKLSTESMIVDPAFLKIFNFPLIEGNSQTALNTPTSIVITEKMAKKMFGTTSAMNKIIKIDSTNFSVTGILKDLPANTRFEFDYLLPWSHVKRLGWDNEDWGSNTTNTFVLLKDNSSFAAVNNKIKNVSRIHSKGAVKEELFLHPLDKWHLYSKFENGIIAGGEIETIRLFAIIAAFILLVACINFMNLSTARSEKRAKEVGIRKVAGANKKSLVFQFLGESLFIVVISGALALFIVQISLPAFDTLIGKELVLPFNNAWFWIAAFIFIVTTGVLAGSYPAFFLSSFKPVEVLKGTFKKMHVLLTPRKVLVVSQFTFAIVLIIGTIVVVNQIRYGQRRKAGYDRNQLVYHFLTGNLQKDYSSVKNELLNSGIASAVCRTSSPMTEGWGDTWNIMWTGKPADDKTVFDSFNADENLVKTVGLRLVQGRDFNLSEFPSDSSGVLLNETAVKIMNFKNPLGQLIRDGDNTFHVIGVIQDFLLNSPYDPIKPMAIEGSLRHNSFAVMNIKLNEKNSAGENIRKLSEVFAKYNPDYPFENHFYDVQYAKKFEDTKRTATLSALFAGLTILITCLGLFGLASFVAGQRTKEIGIRKVLGASVFSLWKMLSKDFIGLVIISLLIAAPTAYYFMNNWLLNFEYRTPLSWWIFGSAGLGALIITILTVSYQSIKAAMSNPVKNLKTE